MSLFTGKPNGPKQLTLADAQEVVQYAARKTEQTRGLDGKWITIGGSADPETGEKHKGGFAVLISSDGTIIKGGPKELRGKKVHEVKDHFNKQRSGTKDEGKEADKAPEKKEEPAKSASDIREGEKPDEAKQISDTAFEHAGHKFNIKKVPKPFGKPGENSFAVFREGDSGAHHVASSVEEAKALIRDNWAEAKQPDKGGGATAPEGKKRTLEEVLSEHKKLDKEPRKETKSAPDFVREGLHELRMGRDNKGATGPITDWLEENGYPKLAEAIRRDYIRSKNPPHPYHSLINQISEGTDLDFLENRQEPDKHSRIVTLDEAADLVRYAKEGRPTNALAVPLE